MVQRKHTPTYTAKFRECDIRFFRENSNNYSSNNAACKAITSRFGRSPDSLRDWCQQAERDAGLRGGLNREEKTGLCHASISGGGLLCKHEYL